MSRLDQNLSLRFVKMEHEGKPRNPNNPSTLASKPHTSSWSQTRLLDPTPNLAYNSSINILINWRFVQLRSIDVRCSVEMAYHNPLSHVNIKQMEKERHNRR